MKESNYECVAHVVLFIRRSSERWSWSI